MINNHNSERKKMWMIIYVRVCRRKDEFSIGCEYLTWNLVYQTNRGVEIGQDMIYIACTQCPLKQRYNNHKNFL